MAADKKKLPGGRPFLAVGSAVLTLVVAGGAQAQSMETNSAAFNAGYGRNAGSENHVVQYSTRDANGNRVIVDGVMLTGADQSVYSSGNSSGSLDSYSGVGGRGGSYGGSTAIGNNLTVITQGNNNTVIVNSSQINNGAISAGTNVNNGTSGNGQ